MPDFYNLSPSELLHAYLEGELDDSQEGVLFHLLADNTELRAEMREQLALSTLVQQDAKSILLPPQIKSATLRAVAAVRNEHIANDIRRRFWASLWLVTRPFVFSTAMATVGMVCALGLLWSVREQAVPQGAGTVVLHSKPVEPITGEDVRTVQNNTRQKNTPALATSQRVSPRSRAAAAQKREPEILFEDNRQEIGEKDGMPLSDNIQPVSVQASVPLPHTPLGKTSLVSSIPEQLPMALSSLGTGRLQLHLRGVAAQSMLQIDVPAQSYPWFQNTAIGALYALSEHHAVGAEFGQEEFVQRYHGKENGQNVYYEQRPLLLWVGAAYQYTAEPITTLGDIRPFGRLVVGGTQTGPLARGLVGLQYRPDARVTFSLGFEGSMLAYQFQNAWFSSEKIGVSYGVSLSF